MNHPQAYAASTRVNLEQEVAALLKRVERLEQLEQFEQQHQHQRLELHKLLEWQERCLQDRQIALDAIAAYDAARISKGDTA